MFNFQRNLVRFVEETVTDRERVTVIVVDLLLEPVTERVRLPVTVRVNGCVLGMPVLDLVMLVEIVYELVGVIDRVKGLVVAIPVIERVILTVRVRVTDTVRVKDTVTLFVKGLVLGIALRVTVIEVEGVGS